MFNIADFLCTSFDNNIFIFLLPLFQNDYLKQMRQLLDLEAELKFESKTESEQGTSGDETKETVKSENNVELKTDVSPPSAIKSKGTTCKHFFNC